MNPIFYLQELISLNERHPISRRICSGYTQRSRGTIPQDYWSFLFFMKSTDYLTISAVIGFSLNRYHVHQKAYFLFIDVYRYDRNSWKEYNIKLNAKKQNWTGLKVDTHIFTWNYKKELLVVTTNNKKTYSLFRN